MHRFKFARQPWFLTLVVGIVLFAVSDLALKATGNLNFLPTGLLLGTFTIPVTFVAYFYQPALS
jgi:hypothetical protein